jgi:transcriptional regulator with XRE-family HTH domain
MNQDKIGKIIKEIRVKKGLTQKEFAEKYNVSFQAVSKWENGKNIPDISLLKQICKDNNISLDEILDNNSTINKKIRYLRFCLLE